LNTGKPRTTFFLKIVFTFGMYLAGFAYISPETIILIFFVFLKNRGPKALSLLRFDVCLVLCPCVIALTRLSGGYVFDRHQSLAMIDFRQTACRAFLKALL